MGPRCRGRSLIPIDVIRPEMYVEIVLHIFVDVALVGRADPLLQLSIDLVAAEAEDASAGLLHSPVQRKRARPSLHRAFIVARLETWHTGVSVSTG